MARTKHQRDHMTTRDENFLYRGELPKRLAQEFIEDKIRTRILCLRGWISSGKTRTAKELVREMQLKLDGGKQEVYTFYFDLKHYGTVKKLTQQIQTTLIENVPGCNIPDSDTLFCELRKVRPDLDRIYLFVVDNLDKVKDEDRSALLSFIEDIVQHTDNVHLVLPSINKVNFVRIPDKVLDYEMGPMDHNDAKELLKDASGNPKDLERHADRIVELVCKLPLALMIAGYEMHKRLQLPYTPEEFVELMEDSATLTLGLDNVPKEDQMTEIIEGDICKYHDILEKILFAVEDPESFDLNELKDSMNAITTAQLKRSILRILLDSSLYRVHCTEEDSDSFFESSPLLMKIFCEVFCSVSCGDSFLKEFNSALRKTVVDEGELKSAKAGGVRKAERLLRKRQKKGCPPDELKALREGVVQESINFLKLVCDDVSKINNFKQLANNIINKIEHSESDDRFPTKSGIQETGAYSASFSLGSPTSHDSEAGARVSPVKLTYHAKETPKPSEDPGKSVPSNGNGEEEEFSRFQTLSSSDNGDQTLCSSEFVSSGPSDVFPDDRTNPGYLAENLQQSLNLHGSPVSSEVDDKKHPVIHHITKDSECGASFSVMSTMTDNQVLTFQNGDSTGEEKRGIGKSGGTGSSAKSLNNQSKEAIESEFDWEMSGCNAEDEAQCKDEGLLENPVQGTAGERKNVQEISGKPGSEGERPVVQKQTMQQESRKHPHSQSRSRQGFHLENTGNAFHGQRSPGHRGDQQYFESSQSVSPGGYNQYHCPGGYSSSDRSSLKSSFVPRGPPQHKSFGSPGYQQAYPQSGFSSPNYNFQPRGPPDYSQRSDHSNIHSLQTQGFEHGNTAYPNYHQQHHGGFQRSPGPAAYPYGQGEQYHGADGGQYGYHYHHQQQQQQFSKYNSQMHDSNCQLHQNNQGKHQNTQRWHYQMNNRGHHQNYQSNQGQRGQYQNIQGDHYQDYRGSSRGRGRSGYHQNTQRGHYQNNRGHRQNHQNNRGQRGQYENNQGDYQDYRGSSRGRGRYPDRYNER